LIYFHQFCSGSNRNAWHLTDKDCLKDWKIQILGVKPQKYQVLKKNSTIHMWPYPMMMEQALSLLTASIFENSRSWCKKTNFKWAMNLAVLWKHMLLVTMEKSLILVPKPSPIFGQAPLFWARHNTFCLIKNHTLKRIFWCEFCALLFLTKEGYTIDYHQK